MKGIRLLKFFRSYKALTLMGFSNRSLGFSYVVILVFMVCLFFGVPLSTATAQVVNIPDPELRAALELALDKESGVDITQADMESLKVLQASRCHFLKRSGVPQWVPILRRCPDSRFGHGIRDLTGLEFAINLEELHLAHNQISDVTPLGALTKLIVLDLHNNFKISDAFPLSVLKNLTHLSLWGNRVSDVSPLSVLTHLTYLSLENNEISDVSPLSTLTNLRGLDLEANQVSDVSPLKVLTNLTHLDFDSNRVSDVSPLAGMTKLTQLDISDNQISDLSPLSALTELTQLDIDDNQVIDISALKNMTKLLWLDIDGNQIIDVSPLKNMTDLTRANLDDNQISDISPLRDLTKLEKLDLDHNQISDVSPLKDLTRLTWLDLDDNKISDVSALKNMTKLELLDLGDNEISDVSPLTDMVTLTELDLNDNEIVDVFPLKNMTRLRIIDLDGNKISDVSPLKNMTRLIELDLHDNRISNISPLTDLTRLMVLDLSENHIFDFSPLARLIENLVEYDNSNQTNPPIKTTDVNRDGVVNIIDLALVAAYYEDPNFSDAASFGIYPDVNLDGVVNIKDLVAIAGEIDAVAAAPTLRQKSAETSDLTVENLRRWLALAKGLESQSLDTARGIRVLEDLLVLLMEVSTVPMETALLANYPNPFNPETWIPYQLAELSEVSISIYSTDGQVVRKLSFGSMPAGMYHSKSRAAYWDGRNVLGESVASGVYFYRLTAGRFTATRKMLIQK